MASLTESLDGATATHRLLDHPFYKAWAEGALSVDDLGFYATQYWRQVEAFPSYLSNVANRLHPGACRAIVEDNLKDEIDGDHAGMWKAFAGSVGIDAGQLESAPREPETTACVHSFSQGAVTQSVAFALGMLYGYESQTPEVARTKSDGLRKFYGIDRAGTRYFDVHADLDVTHAAELADAIENSMNDDSGRHDAIRGAAHGAAAVWQLLDGVARVRDLENVS